MNAKLPLAASALLCLVTAFNAVAQTKDLKSLRDTYNEGMARIESSHAEEARQWPIAYSRGLAALKTQMQKAGDLEGWETIGAEINRFSESKTIAESDIVTAKATLGSLQRRYAGMSARSDGARNEKTLKLVKLYIRHLRRLQKELTRKGDIDEALKVKAEIGRVQGSEEVIAASFAMAEREAQEVMDRQKPVGPSRTAPPTGQAKSRVFSRLAGSPTERSPGAKAAPLSEIEKLAAAQGGARGDWVDVLPIIDVARDAVEGQWVTEDGSLKQLQRGWPIKELVLPVGIGDSYAIEIEFTKLTGGQSVNIRFPVRREYPFLVICGYPDRGYNSEVRHIFDKTRDVKENPSSVKSQPLENGRRYRCNLRVVVDGDEVQIASELDGQELVHWRGPTRMVSNPGVGDRSLFCRKLTLAVPDGTIEFHRVRVRSLEGVSGSTANPPARGL
jgi:hypothetical protein